MFSYQWLNVGHSTEHLHHRSNRYVLFRTVPSSATTTPTRSLTYAASLVCIQCRQLPAELLTRCFGALRWAVSCCVRQQYAAATTTLLPLSPEPPQLPTLSLRLFCSPALYHTKRTLAATESDISRLPALHLALSAPLLTLTLHLPTYCHSVDTSDWLMSCDNILDQCEDNPFVFEETRLRGFVSNGLKNEKVRFDDGFGMRSMFVRPTGVRCRALSCLSGPPRTILIRLGWF